MSDKKPLRIALCTHAFNSVDFRVYFNHLWCIAHWAKTFDIVFCGKKGLDSATARNQLVEKAIQTECTHLFFMDADHLFPLETLDCLTQWKDEAIVSGLVCKRGEGYSQVCFNKNGQNYIPTELPLDGNCHQVAICAFGCTLVSMHHLLKLKKPFFRDICRDVPNGDPYNFRSDIVLCEAFGEIGEKCFVDTRVLIGHHGIDREVYPQNAKVMAQMDQMELEQRKLKSDQKGFFYACT